MSTAAIIALTSNAHHWGPFADGPVFWPIFPVLWFLLVVGGIIAAVVLTRQGRRVAPWRQAEAHLATRYATGEITEDEYRVRRAVLREKK